MRPVSLLGTSGNGLERHLLAFLDPLLSCAALVVEAHNGPIPGGRFPTGITSVVSEGNNEVGDYLVAALRGEPRLITYVRGWSGVLDLSSLREAGIPLRTASEALPLGNVLGIASHLSRPGAG